MDLDRLRKPALIAVLIMGLGSLMYLGGLLGQAASNYREWMSSDGISGKRAMVPVDWNILICLQKAISPSGLKAMAGVLGIGGIVFMYVRFHDRFGGSDFDPRGFRKSSSGTYGTAGWMNEKEMKEILEIASPSEAEGVILGEYEGKAVCMPKDTRLNRHIAVFGASGTMKSRAIIRNALFQAIKRGESVVITDPKAELYNDTSKMFCNEGYEVKVYNLVDPENSDSWNCMSDLHGSTLMAQMLTNIIIGNTSNGKGDHFWDNGEGNLLKALILLVDLDPTRGPETKHLPAVYQMLTRNSERQLTALFEKLPIEHPARAPYNLFAQSSDTVKSGIIQGLGTRLQVLQNREVVGITSRSDIDLSAPGKRRCAYYLILSDQDTTMAFLSSLFFSLMFLKLTRFADGRPEGRCDVPVNLILDEFNNVGRIGGAADGSDFARSLSVIRSRDIRVMMVVQSLGQLQNRYGNNLWAELVGNCDIQLMLGCTDDVTAEYFSARSGEMSIEVSSTMTTRQTIAVAQVIPQYRQTQGEGRRQLLTPDEVLRLPNEELLVIIRGCNILKLNKLDYTRHPMSAKLIRTSIMDYHTRPGNAMESRTQKEYSQTGINLASDDTAHQTEGKKQKNFSQTGMKLTSDEKNRRVQVSGQEAFSQTGIKIISEEAELRMQGECQRQFSQTEMKDVPDEMDHGSEESGQGQFSQTGMKDIPDEMDHGSEENGQGQFFQTGMKNASDEGKPGSGDGIQQRFLRTCNNFASGVASYPAAKNPKRHILQMGIKSFISKIKKHPCTSDAVDDIPHTGEEHTRAFIQSFYMPQTETESVDAGRMEPEIPQENLNYDHAPQTEKN